MVPVLVNGLNCVVEPYPIELNGFTVNPVPPMPGLGLGLPFKFIPGLNIRFELL
jgi:hypothetical protein